MIFDRKVEPEVRKELQRKATLMLKNAARRRTGKSEICRSVYKCTQRCREQLNWSIAASSRDLPDASV